MAPKQYKLLAEDELLGSPRFARDRATALMPSVVLFVLSVLLDAQLLLLPSLTLMWLG